MQSNFPNRNASKSTVTADEYGTLQYAYDYFNGSLFEGALPQVLITLPHRRGTRGYFSPDRFQRRERCHEVIHEVALIPEASVGRSDEEILSTLLHEMVHVWQKEYGRSGRGRYHNREWARKMHSLGLMPSSTGEPGGKTTGDRVSHYVIEDGPFAIACRQFLTVYRLAWESSTVRPPKPGVVANPTRSKFTCPNCGRNAWAQPGALLDCHRCSEEAGESVLMIAFD